MRFKLLFSVLLATTACSGLPFPGMFGGSSNTKQTSSTTNTNKTEETHTINGHPVDRDGNREDDAPVSKKKTADAAPASKGKQRGGTCHHNEDCASEVCFTGRGSLGYCTQICDDDFGCPSFWECKHVGNAPQRICMQEKD